ncbi:MAG: glycine/sarcosine/betaine reductase component B subunit [Dehalococcoidia bacterium]
MAKRCDMRLEIGTFRVRDVAFSDATKLRDGVLYIDKEKVVEMVMEDHNFSGADLHLVRPGDSTRLVNLLDVVEPRCKVSGPGNTFPGLLGPPVTVGRGRTNRLDNVALMETSEPVTGSEPANWRDSIMDMSGPGARYNMFANTLNIVLDLKPRSDFSPEEMGQLELTNYNRGSQWVQRYHRSVRIAGSKVAAYLAEVTKDLVPDQVDVYEVGPADPSLPKVAYSCQVLYHLMYGEPLGWQPTFVHPNELMDGILVNPHTPPAAHRDATYVMQNNPLIRELYQRHGKELNFFGVLVYRAEIKNLEDKERSTDYAAKLLQMMDIDGIVMTWTGSGNPGMDIMMLAQKCEQRGIRASMINVEMAMTEEDDGFVYFVPEADAIVNAGNYERTIDLPAPDILIGGTKIRAPEMDVSGQVTLTLRYLYGATNVLGATRLAGVPY